MKELRIIIILLLFLPMAGYSQKVSTIKGKISDKAAKVPLIGVTIIEVNADNRILNGTTTDVSGNFTLVISNPNPLLKISYIGYRTMNLQPGENEFLNIELEEDLQMLQEVVITAESKKVGGLNPVSVRDLTGSVDAINMKNLEDLKVTNIGEALQGRSSNVDITLASGDPGAGMSIRIRGTASISGSNEPLIVVDGVPFEMNLDKNFDFAGATQEKFSGLLNITPEDILSIQVLKDASATAVWGSRGANGVILIETKRGTKGKNSFEYLYKLSVNQKPRTIPLLDGYSYSMLQLEELFNAGITEVPPELAYDKENENYYNYSQNTNWVDAITQTGISHEHNLSMTGGGDNALYRFSVGYLNQTGTTIGTKYDRFTSRFNLDYNVSSKLVFSGDFSYTYGNNRKSYPGTAYNEDSKDEFWNTIRALAYVKAPNMSIYEYDANGNITNQYFTPEVNFQGQGYEWYNPVAMAREASSTEKDHRIRTKLSLRYNVLKDLVFTSFVAYDLNNSSSSRFLPYQATGSNWTSTFINLSAGMDYESSSLETQSQLTYTLTRGNHKLTAMSAFILSDSKTGWYFGSTSNSPSVYITNYTQPAPVYWIGDDYNESRMAAFLGFLHYSLLDRYLIQFNIRREGSSLFGYNYRWGTFPSISLAYRLSSENFMKRFKFINDLKIRYSYGINGNQPYTNYGYFSRYGTNGQYIDIPVVVPQSIQLDNFRWERNAQSNLGFDFTGFHSRFDLHFDIYEQNSKDLIWENLSLPSSSGFTQITRNWGAMNNHGWEFSTNMQIIDRKDFQFSLNFNIARNVNVIKEIPKNFDFEKGNEAANGQYASRAQVGNAIGTFYGFRYQGVFPTDADAIAHDVDGNPLIDLNGKPIYMRYGNSDGYRFKGGDAIYQDINHDGLINQLDIVKIGDSNPDFFGGFGPRVDYKNFTLNLFFHYRVGYDVVNRTKMLNESMYSRNNQSVSVLNRWRKPGDITGIPRALYNQGYNWLGSDRFVEDGSFLRFKSASISYNFADFARKLKFRELKINFLIYNLYTWTSYTGVDPEVPIISTDPFFIGEDKSDTPPPKDFIISLSVRF
jgi:TonB-linked SusC/RagA family outer membrane protein